MYKSVITNTSRVIELRQMGTGFRIVVLHAVWSDVEIWHDHTLEAAQARFQALVALNTRKPANKRTVAQVEFRS